MPLLSLLVRLVHRVIWAVRLVYAASSAYLKGFVQGLRGGRSE